MHSIAIVSQKGGVGKTTVSLNLALAIARAGNRTLIMELDAQGSMGLSLGLPDRARPGIAEILTGVETLDKVLIRTRDQQLHVLTVGRVDPATVSGFEDALGKVATRALEASTHVLSPLQAEPLALRSVGQLLALVDRIKADKNPKLTFLGILLSMFDRQTAASREGAETLWTRFPGGLILDTVIPRDQTFLEASLRGAPLLLMQRRPPPLARIFDQLANELLVRIEPNEGATKEEDDGPIPLLV